MTICFDGSGLGKCMWRNQLTPCVRPLTTEFDAGFYLWVPVPEVHGAILSGVHSGDIGASCIQDSDGREETGRYGVQKSVRLIYVVNESRKDERHRFSSFVNEIAPMNIHHGCNHFWFRTFTCGPCQGDLEVA